MRYMVCVLVRQSLHDSGHCRYYNNNNNNNINMVFSIIHTFPIEIDQIVRTVHKPLKYW